MSDEYLTAECPEDDCDWTMSGWTSRKTQDAAQKAHNRFEHGVLREEDRRWR